MNEQRKNKYELFKEKLLNHPFIAIIVLLFVIAAAGLHFYTEIRNFFAPIFSKEQMAINTRSDDRTVGGKIESEISIDLEQLNAISEYYNNARIHEITDTTPRERQVFKNKCISIRSDSIKTLRTLDPCVVNDFDYFSTIDNLNFFYALYTFPRVDKNENNLGIVIFEGEINSDKVRPVLARLDLGATMPSTGFSKPSIVNTKFGKILYLPDYCDGTGDFNDDNFFIWKKTKWISLDSETWQSNLHKRLPNGYHIMNGMVIDLSNFKVETYLWENGDAHCCPTGGKAEVSLIIQNEKFIIKNITFKPVAKEEE